MKKIQSIGSVFRSIIFAAMLFLSSCSQKAEIPDVDYAVVWKVLGGLV